MSCAEALRRCPQAVFVRPRHTLYRQYSQAVWQRRPRGRADGRADRDRRGLPRPRRGRGRTSWPPRASSPRRCRRPCAARRASPCSLGVATCKVVAKVATRPAQARRAHRRPARARGGVPRAVRRAPAARRRPAGRGAARARRASRRSARSPRSTTTTCGACCPARSGRCSATARAGSTRGRSRPRSSAISISHEETFERDIADRERAARRAAADGRAASPSYLADAGPVRPHGDDEGALPRLLDPQPLDDARRPASTTRETIGELACALLDRALADRPGPLRLVGVGVSNIEPFRQLALS